jgi:POT family proton-dependent oligopeptide transporter
MMGTWFLGTALGNLAAGQIGGRLGSDVTTMPAEFTRMALIGAGAGAAMLLMAPLIRRWSGTAR